MQNQLECIMEALCEIRCPAACTEEELHRQVASVMDAAGIEVLHEAQLAPRCRIDFLADGIGIEIKKNRPDREKLIVQLTRYAACEQIEQLLVIAPKGVNLPKRLCGKPVTMFALERLWGICLP